MNLYIEEVIMAKWADYGISAVRYSTDETHIDKVKVHEDKDTRFGNSLI